MLLYLFMALAVGGIMLYALCCAAQRGDEQMDDLAAALERDRTRHRAMRMIELRRHLLAEHDEGDYAQRQVL